MKEESERVQYLIKNWSHLQLAREYDKLETNWKELKKWMNSEMERFEDNLYTRLGIAVFTKVLSKMQELENKDG